MLKQQKPDREFHYTTNDFERIRQLIYKFAGIFLSPSKRDMAYSRLARRLRATGFVRFDDYLNTLESEDSPERQAFTNSLTTNLTSFFREPHHFPILENHLATIKTRGRLRIWCAASSTGQEPYSIAITAAEAFGSYEPPVEIIASDLDTNVLAKAQEGIYEMDDVKNLTPGRLKKFFLKGRGPHEGMVRVRSELTKLITFKQVNLLDQAWPIEGSFDAIFCRNVMIYFDKPTQYKILGKFAPLLQPDGLLFAGHSENFHTGQELFVPCGKTVYKLNDGE